MIKFFRQLRQQLLAQNKFSKYLIYAIGEITLWSSACWSPPINGWKETQILNSNKKDQL